MKKASYILGAICLVAVLFGVGMAAGKSMEVHAESTVTLGDLDNSAVADKQDAIVLEKHLTGETEITDTNVLDAADTNGDGAVNVKDLVRYRRYCTEASETLSGTGSTSDPYLVENLSDLFCLQRMVNNYEVTGDTTNKHQFNGKHIKLTSDIAVNVGTLTDVTTGTLVVNPDEELIRQWTPIGNGAQFAGIFSGSKDGGDYIREITGIYVSENVAGVGLFGTIGSVGTVKNLKLKNSYIYSDVNNDTGSVGSVVGNFGASGNVENIYSDAVVLAPNAKRCGGLFGMYAGNADRIASNCMFAGYIKAEGRCGGIAGAVRLTNQNNQRTFTFQGCSNVGTVVSTMTDGYTGGIVGMQDRLGNDTQSTVVSLNLLQCFDAGTLIFNSGATTIGTLIGARLETGADSTSYETQITDCYATTKYSSSDVVLDLALISDYDSTAEEDDCTIINSHIYPENFLNGWDGYRLTTLDFTSENAYWTAVVDGIPELTTWTDATDKIAITSNAARASFDWKETYDSTTKTYSIDSVEDLYGIEADSRLGINNVKNGEYTRNGFGGATLKLEDNIIFNTDINNPVNEWNPIGDSTQQFYGTFDGNNKEILGLYINTDQQRVGLFGQCHANSTIKNVVIKDGRIISTFSGEAYVGSVVGFAQGTVEDVYSNAIIECAGAECGGIVGRFGGGSEKTISKCWFDGEVSSSSNYCAGIVGRVILGTKTITNCVNTGIITSTYSGVNPVYTAGICGGLVSQSAQTVSCVVSNCVNEGTIIVESKMLAESKYAGTVVGNTVNTKTSNGDTITLSNLYTTQYVNNGNWIENPEYYKNSEALNALVDTLNSIEAGVWEYDSNTARLELVWYTGSTTTH